MKQPKYSGDVPAHATVPANTGHTHKYPTPKVHPAYQALYGKPQEPEQPADNGWTEKDAIRVKALLSQISVEDKRKLLTFLQALHRGDTATVERMQRESEEEAAYLQRERARGRA